MTNLIIYGDIHGCYSEFISLRNKINPNQNDIEVCVGDILTKGQDSLKTLDFIIKNNIKSVLGNHEDKILRYLKHSKLAKQNPIKLDNDEQNIIHNLTNQHISYLIQLPLFLQYYNITIVHGGIHNNMDLNNLSKREKEQVLRMRYLDQDEKYLALGKEDENSIFWADIYTGNQGFIVYGHDWSKEPRKSKYALGIDTGCVYGNKLTAVVFRKINQHYILDEDISNNLYSVKKL